MSLKLLYKSINLSPHPITSRPSQLPPPPNLTIFLSYLFHLISSIFSFLLSQVPLFPFFLFGCYLFCLLTARSMMKNAWTPGPYTRCSRPRRTPSWPSWSCDWSCSWPRTSVSSPPSLPHPWLAGYLDLRYIFISTSNTNKEEFNLTQQD